MKKALPAFKAYADGKIIQLRKKGAVKWVDFLEDDIVVSQYYEYRIKPKPKYRPFKSQEECWNEMLKHQPFGWIKDDYKYIHISSVFKDEIECSPDEDDDGNLHACIIKFTSVYEQGYTFADGEPFGIKEE